MWRGWVERVSSIERGGVEGAPEFVELFCTFSGVLHEHAERGSSVVVGHMGCGGGWGLSKSFVVWP